MDETLGDPDDIRAFAARICELKPKARDAVAMLRRVRIGRQPKASPLDLAFMIIDTINGYTTKRPELTPEELDRLVGMAMENVRDIIEGDRNEKLHRDE